MAIGSGSKGVRIVTMALVVVAVLAVALAGCSQFGQNAGKSSNGKESLVDLGEQAVQNLGGEKHAVTAVLFAWDKGYSLEQIVRAITDNRLTANGNINNIEPGGRPQNYLSLAVPAVRLASADIQVTPLNSPRSTDKVAIWKVVDRQQAMWTAWLLGVIAKGYSVEQITLYMLEARKPAVMVFPNVGPVITETKLDPKTRKRVQVVVRPKFPPKGSTFNPEELQGTDRFISDLAKDFDDLIAGRSAVRPEPSGKPGEKPAADDSSKAPAAGKSGGRFEPRSFRLELLLSSDKLGTLRRSDLIIRIDENGRVEGSYDAKLVRGDTTKYEDGTFGGQAVYPKTKGQFIRMDLDGSRHMKTVIELSDGRTTAFEQNISIPKMFQGTVAVDYSQGQGYLYGESATYRWRLP